MKDHGELTGEEGKNSGEASSGDKSSSTWKIPVESIISNSNCYENFGFTATLLWPSRRVKI